LATRWSAALYHDQAAGPDLPRKYIELIRLWIIARREVEHKIGKFGYLPETMSFLRLVATISTNFDQK
jgi:hypothetical protein